MAQIGAFLENSQRRLDLPTTIQISRRPWRDGGTSPGCHRPPQVPGLQGRIPPQVLHCRRRASSTQTDDKGRRRRPIGEIEKDEKREDKIKEEESMELRREETSLQPSDSSPKP